MTILLRILTGMHAGAELRLGAGSYRVGSDDDADIRISDWRGVDVQLIVDDSGLVSARRLEPEPQAESDEASLDENAQASVDAAAQAPAPAPADEASDEASTIDPGTVLLVDFVPMQFDETVLCVGPADTIWPSDLELLSTLLTKPEPAPRIAASSSRRKIVGIALACSMLGSIIVIGSVLITMAVSRAAAPHDAADLAVGVNRELTAAHLDELHARIQGSRVIVNGMVGNSEEDAAARALLSRLAPNAIARQYDIAQIDVRTLEESLNTPGLQVKYAGNGVFEISGSITNPSDVNARLARMRHELSPNIKQLRVQVAQSENNIVPPEAFSVLMTSDTVRYAETPDGVKHIYALPEEAIAPAVDAAGGEALVDEAAVSDAAAAASGAAPAFGAAPAATASAPAAPASGAVAAVAPPGASSPQAVGVSSAAAVSAAAAAPAAASAATQARAARNARAAPHPAPPKTAYLPLPRH